MKKGKVLGGLMMVLAVAGGYAVVAVIRNYAYVFETMTWLLWLIPAIVGVVSGVWVVVMLRRNKRQRLLKKKEN